MCVFRFLVGLAVIKHNVCLAGTLLLLGVVSGLKKQRPTEKIGGSVNDAGVEGESRGGRRMAGRGAASSPYHTLGVFFISITAY